MTASTNAALQELAAILARMPEEEWAEAAPKLAWLLAEKDADFLMRDWRTLARPEQLPPPGPWRVWLFQAGRGAGKTRAAAEWFNERAMSGKYRHGAMVAPDPGEARRFMIEGPSGLLNIGSAQDRPKYEPSIAGGGRLVWRNGFEALIFSAEDPEGLRGLNADTAWASEVGKWPLGPTRKAEVAWHNLELGLRIGQDPRCVIDTTPRRGSRLLQKIKSLPTTVITHSTTYANAANLGDQYIESMRKQYEGTSLGKQELLGEDVEEVEGALWKHEMFRYVQELPDEAAIIAIGVDPSGSATGAEAGIVAAATDRRKEFGWVIADRSDKLSPDQWANRAMGLYRDLSADAIVVERNFGGDMCRATIEKAIRLTGEQPPRIIEVTASRGKRIRAEPIAMLYEQGRIEHLPGLGMLESEMATWNAENPREPSPNRLDACLIAGTLVDTISGQAPIETVKSGDFVRTRKGWRRVIWSGQTGIDKPVRRLELSNGATLTGTLDHPVFTINRGFVALDELVWEDTLLTNRRVPWLAAASRLYGWMAKNTVDIPKAHQGVLADISYIAASMADCIIAICGRSTTAPYRLVATSTIETVIRSTTPWRIWSVSRRGNMLLDISRNSLRLDERIMTRSAHSRRLGMPRLLAALGIASTPKRAGADGMLSQLVIASNAGNPSGPMGKARNSARGHAAGAWPIEKNATSSTQSAPSVGGRSRRSAMAKLRRPVRVHVVSSSDAGTAPTWNLEVEGEPEFYANGILVHNCVWALSWLMTGNMPGSISQQRLLGI